jgi:methionyl-tRNA formyltransferase
MAIDISESEPEPNTQVGTPTIFKRRTPADSQLVGDQDDLLAVFDHIRMLDADGYPRAYAEVGEFRLEFSRAALYHDGIRADVRISMKNKGQNS